MGIIMFFIGLSMLLIGFIAGRKWERLKAILTQGLNHVPVLLCAVLLAGCGGKEQVSWETQEMARKQAIDNAEYNAKKFRDSYAQDFSVLMRGDSSITATCAQGDGWASVDLMKNDQKIELKCSTVSGTIGCMVKKDFQARPDYAQQDGTCNTALPFPLPKITL